MSSHALRLSLERLADASNALEAFLATHAPQWAGYGQYVAEFASELAARGVTKADIRALLDRAYGPFQGTFNSMHDLCFMGTLETEYQELRAQLGRALDAVEAAFRSPLIVVETEAVSLLAAELVALGGGRANLDHPPQLALIGAATLQGAREALESLSDVDRGHSLLVGLDDEALDARQQPSVGNLAGVLEQYRPLGVLWSGAVDGWRSNRAGFIGLKRVATEMCSEYLNLHSSRNYAAYTTLVGASAVDFLSRYLAVASPTRHASDP